MKRIAIALFSILAFCALTRVANAQLDYVPGTIVSMSSSCGPNNSVVLRVVFNVGEAPPANITGWAIERRVVGECLPTWIATEVMPWPEVGSSVQEISFTATLPHRDEIFHIWGIDDQGRKIFIPWPSRDNWEHADCMGGPSTVGYIVMMGDRPVFEVCPNSCWWELNVWDFYCPDDLAELADTGILVNIYGEMKNGMEGPYIDGLTWSVSDEYCATVPAEEPSWDAVKAFYR